MRHLTEEQRKKQQKMPILDMTEAFVRENQGYFCIPGHRFERGMNSRLKEQYGEGLYRYDLTETDNLDDLHHAEGPILEAQRLAAELFGSDRCWFLVNGTTCGNEAMILAAVKPGEKILIPRNAHKSVTMGLILSGAVPVWIQPEKEESWGTAGILTPERVEEKLTEDPEIKAVFLVSPTYYGICSDVRGIAAVCHSHGVPLLVDEAHGSHLYFHPECPEGAIEAGADACAQSTHKTLGSMTQTSMLHLQGQLLSQERVDESLKMVMSTSPSYVLMAAIDAARQQMAVDGERILTEAIQLSDKLRKEVAGIPGYRILDGENLDPLRIVISADELGLSGEELQELLYEKGKISLELADPVSVVLVLTWGNTVEEINHLLHVLKSISDDCLKRVSGETVNKKKVEIHVYKTQELPAPEVSVTPRTAWYLEKESILLEDSSGRIAGELIVPYPPGIPVLCPGERITEELIDYLKECAERNCVLHGPADESLQTIRVISDFGALTPESND